MDVEDIRVFLDILKKDETEGKGERRRKETRTEGEREKLNNILKK